MQNTIHTLKLLCGKKYWWEALDCGSETGIICLYIFRCYYKLLFFFPHVLMAALCNWMFGGTELLFCVQQTLMPFWVLHLLNKGRMMGMCRLMGPQGIIWIELKRVWGREEIRHVFLTVKPGLKQMYCFIVNKGLPST